LLAAVLLESAIRYSPYNAYLKISAMFVYSQLNAVSRSWDLFRDLYIKHIQHESCAYLILPLLRAGGFYQETISVCQEILRLQTASAREAIEFSGRAMENGALSKADECITFHRERMNKSLTTLEAKGLILDCAPMYKQNDDRDTLGAVHGIVGGESDLEFLFSPTIFLSDESLTLAKKF
jgi:N-acetyltransferase B complex (NatB) non catalytic subunit